MDTKVAERRLQRRFSGTALSVGGTMRPGCPVTIIDISQRGLRVESDRPLRPGTRVHVRLDGQEWTRHLWAVVLRCTVSTLHPSRVVYRGALLFEERCPSIPEH
jgi:hypothetical protein